MDGVPFKIDDDSNVEYLDIDTQNDNVRIMNTDKKKKKYDVDKLSSISFTGIASASKIINKDFILQAQQNTNSQATVDKIVDDKLIESVNIGSCIKSEYNETKDLHHTLDLLKPIQSTDGGCELITIDSQDNTSSTADCPFSARDKREFNKNGKEDDLASWARPMQTIISDVEEDSFKKLKTLVHTAEDKGIKKYIFGQNEFPGIIDKNAPKKCNKLNPNFLISGELSESTVPVAFAIAEADCEMKKRRKDDVDSESSSHSSIVPVVKNDRSNSFNKGSVASAASDNNAYISGVPEVKLLVKDDESSNKGVSFSIVPKQLINSFENTCDAQGPCLKKNIDTTETSKSEKPFLGFSDRNELSESNDSSTSITNDLSEHSMSEIGLADNAVHKEDEKEYIVVARSSKENCEASLGSNIISLLGEDCSESLKKDFMALNDNCKYISSIKEVSPVLVQGLSNELRDSPNDSVCQVNSSVKTILNNLPEPDCLEKDISKSSVENTNNIKVIDRKENTCENVSAGDLTIKETSAKGSDGNLIVGKVVFEPKAKDFLITAGPCTAMSKEGQSIIFKNTSVSEENEPPKVNKPNKSCIIDGHILNDPSAEKILDKRVTADGLILNDPSTEKVLVTRVNADDHILNDPSTEKVLVTRVTADDHILNYASTEKILDKPVTADDRILNNPSAEKILDKSVTAADIILNDPSTEKILDKSVTAADIILNDPSTEKILVDPSITADDPISSDLNTGKILNSSVTADDLISIDSNSRKILDTGDTADDHILNDARTKKIFDSRVIADDHILNDPSTKKILGKSVTADNLTLNIQSTGKRLDKSVTVDDPSLNDPSTDKILVDPSVIADDPISNDLSTGRKILNTSVTADDLISIDSNSKKILDTVAVDDHILNDAGTEKMLDTSITVDDHILSDQSTEKMLDTIVIEDGLILPDPSSEKILDTSVIADDLILNDTSTVKILDPSVTVDGPISNDLSSGKILNTIVNTDDLILNDPNNEKILDTNVTVDDPISKDISTRKIFNTNVTADDLISIDLNTRKILDIRVIANVHSNVLDELGMQGRAFIASTDVSELVNNSMKNVIQPGVDCAVSKGTSDPGSSSHLVETDSPEVMKKCLDTCALINKIDETASIHSNYKENLSISNIPKDIKTIAVENMSLVPSFTDSLNKMESNIETSYTGLSSEFTVHENIALEVCCKRKLPADYSCFFDLKKSKLELCSNTLSSEFAGSSTTNETISNQVIDEERLNHAFLSPKLDSVLSSGNEKTLITFHDFENETEDTQFLHSNKILECPIDVKFAESAEDTTTSRSCNLSTTVITDKLRFSDSSNEYQLNVDKLNNTCKLKEKNKAAEIEISQAVVTKPEHSIISNVEIADSCVSRGDGCNEPEDIVPKSSIDKLLTVVCVSQSGDPLTVSDTAMESLGKIEPLTSISDVNCKKTLTENTQFCIGIKSLENSAKTDIPVQTKTQSSELNILHFSAMQIEDNDSELNTVQKSKIDTPYVDHEIIRPIVGAGSFKVDNTASCFPVESISNASPLESINLNIDAKSSEPMAQISDFESHSSKMLWANCLKATLDAGTCAECEKLNVRDENIIAATSPKPDTEKSVIGCICSSIASVDTSVLTVSVTDISKFEMLKGTSNLTEMVKSNPVNERTVNISDYKIDNFSPAIDSIFSKSSHMPDIATASNNPVVKSTELVIPKYTSRVEHVEGTTSLEGLSTLEKSNADLEKKNVSIEKTDVVVRPIIDCCSFELKDSTMSLTPVMDLALPNNESIRETLRSDNFIENLKLNVDNKRIFKPVNQESDKVKLIQDSSTSIGLRKHKCVISDIIKPDSNLVPLKHAQTSIAETISAINKKNNFENTQSDVANKEITFLETGIVNLVSETVKPITESSTYVPGNNAFVSKFMEEQSDVDALELSEFSNEKICDVSMRNIFSKNTKYSVPNQHKSENFLSESDTARSVSNSSSTPVISQAVKSSLDLIPLTLFSHVSNIEIVDTSNKEVFCETNQSDALKTDSDEMRTSVNSSSCLFSGMNRDPTAVKHASDMVAVNLIQISDTSTKESFSENVSFSMPDTIKHIAEIVIPKSEIEKLDSDAGSDVNNFNLSVCKNVTVDHKSENFDSVKLTQIPLTEIPDLSNLKVVTEKIWCNIPSKIDIPQSLSPITDFDKRVDQFGDSSTDTSIAVPRNSSTIPEIFKPSLDLVPSKVTETSNCKLVNTTNNESVSENVANNIPNIYNCEIALSQSDSVREDSVPMRPFNDYSSCTTSSAVIVSEAKKPNFDFVPESFSQVLENSKCSIPNTILKLDTVVPECDTMKLIRDSCVSIAADEAVSLLNPVQKSNTEFIEATSNITNKAKIKIFDSGNVYSPQKVVEKSKFKQDFLNKTNENIGAKIPSFNSIAVPQSTSFSKVENSIGSEQRVVTKTVSTQPVASETVVPPNFNLVKNKPIHSSKLDSAIVEYSESSSSDLDESVECTETNQSNLEKSNSDSVLEEYVPERSDVYITETISPSDFSPLISEKDRRTSSPLFNENNGNFVSDLIQNVTTLSVTPVSKFSSCESAGEKHFVTSQLSQLVDYSESSSDWDSSLDATGAEALLERYGLKIDSWIESKDTSELTSFKKNKIASPILEVTKEDSTIIHKKTVSTGQTPKKLGSKYPSHVNDNIFPPHVDLKKESYLFSKNTVESKDDFVNLQSDLIIIKNKNKFDAIEGGPSSFADDSNKNIHIVQKLNEEEAPNQEEFSSVKKIGLPQIKKLNSTEDYFSVPNKLSIKDEVDNIHLKKDSSNKEHCMPRSVGNSSVTGEVIELKPQQLDKLTSFSVSTNFLENYDMTEVEEAESKEHHKIGNGTDEVVSDSNLSITELENMPSDPIPELNKVLPEEIIKQEALEEDLCDISLVGVQSFDWDGYLEETHAESTPPTAFLHVEQSIETGIKDGQFVEVLSYYKSHEGSSDNKISKLSTYWPAKVLSSCGLLIRLRYEVMPHVKDINLEFWKDLSTKNDDLKPVGWSSERGIPMKLPSHLSSSLSNVSFDLEIKEMLSVPKETFEFDRCEIFARVRVGNLLEVQDSKNPYEGWVARVKENHGGLLLLEPFNLDLDEREVWLFFSDSRIKPLHWFRRQGEPYRYKHATIPDNVVDHTEPSLSFLLGLQTEPNKHRFCEGMYVEAVLPTMYHTIHVASISRVFDDIFFELDIDGYRWLTTSVDPLIFPANFCEENGIQLHAPKEYSTNKFSWKDFLHFKSALVAGPEAFFKHSLASELGFKEGQKLEAVNPVNEDQICKATVKKVIEHLLVIQISAELTFFRGASSKQIYPVGWSLSNQLTLYVPQFVKKRKCVGNEANDQNLLSVKEIKANNIVIKSETTNQNSLWCDRLYINHCCYAGPYLSKSKIAKLSQSVGPGPVHLVLREVLGRTINAGYVPTRVLKELTGISCVNPSWRSIALKAKFRRHNLKSSVNIAFAARDVDLFLTELSKNLLCCHNLWSFKLSGEVCPYDCNGLNPAYSAAGNATSRGRGGIRGSIARRKRGKKRFLYPIKTSVNCEETERQGEDDDDEDEGDEALSGSEVEGASRPSSPLLELQRKMKQKRLLSSLEIHMNEPKITDTSPGHKLRGGSKRPRDVMELRDSSHLNACRSRDNNISITEQENPRKRTKPELRRAANNPYCLEPAKVISDPINWSVRDVENYVLSQPSICHHAVRLREHEVDGRAFMLLNLPTLVHYLNLPHSSAVTLAQHICKVKLAHFVNYST